MKFGHILIFMVATSLPACSDGEFAGSNGIVSNKKIIPPKKSCDPSKETCDKPPTTEVDPPGLDVQTGGNPNQVLCVKKPGGATYSLAVPAHRDSARNNSTHLPQADVMESAVQKFEFKSLQGNLLNVTHFGLDDVAFIVKESDTIAAIASGRTISVPVHALMIYNANDPNYAAGAVDSTAQTVYKFPGKPDVRVGTGKSNLRAIYNLGAPLIAHNAIKLSDLKDKGFVDAAGNVAFKLMHVAHGIGSVGMTIRAEPCK